MSFFGNILGGNSSSDKRAELEQKLADIQHKEYWANKNKSQQAAAQQAAAQQAAAQQKAAAEAKRQAEIKVQTEAGRQAQLQGESAARQSLSGMNVAQQSQNKATASSQPSVIGGGGGGFDMNQNRQASLQQFSGGTPQINQGSGGTQRPSNLYNLPSISGLTFGGA